MQKTVIVNTKTGKRIGTVTEKNILYDILRYVYGYIRTSCQHINKFARLIIEKHY